MQSQKICNFISQERTYRLETKASAYGNMIQLACTHTHVGKGEGGGGEGEMLTSLTKNRPCLSGYTKAKDNFAFLLLAAGATSLTCKGNTSYTVN